MAIIHCKRCGKIETEDNKCQLHHLIPKFVGGTDKDGRRYLCTKCHSILHNIIPKLIWKSIPEEEKQKVRNKIKSFSLWWIEK